MDPNTIPFLDVIPEPWRSRLILLVAVSPIISRAYYRLINGGGIRGMVRAIWIGDNTPKPPAA